jgi:glucose/mannose-6-phosphate isomerase
MRDDQLELQNAYVPEVVGVVPYVSSVVCGGMGGSALHTEAVASLVSSPSITIHRDYGLPAIAPVDALYVATSYSGNTEEALSFYNAAREAGRTVAVITSGGALLELARSQGVPYVVVPAGITPRYAFLALAKAFLALIGQDALLAEWHAYRPDRPAIEAVADPLSRALRGRVPLIYASRRNEALAYFAKIAINESAKAPAFMDVFPEMNHNELQSFSAAGEAAALVKSLAPVLLRDPADTEHITARMDAFVALMERHEVPVVAVPLPEGDRSTVILWSWFLFLTVAGKLADVYGVSPETNPLIDEFKQML